MNKPIKLSNEELSILLQLDNDQLRLLREWKDQPSFQAVFSLVNIMIDAERNYIFSLNEGGMTPVQLSLKHAYSRGITGAGAKILRLAAGAHGELARREEAKRRQKEVVHGQSE